MNREPAIRNAHLAILFSIAALAFLFFFEAARELTGATYNLNLATMSINVSVISVFAFFSPIVYLFGLARVDSRILVLVSGISLGVWRLAMTLDPAAVVYLLFTVSAVASFGIFLPSLILQFRALHSEGDGHLRFICAVVTGAGADLVFRILGNTFDITVYGISAERLTALFMVLPLVVVYVAALTLNYRSTRTMKDTSAEIEFEPKRKLSAFFGCSVGVLFFLYLVLLGYPNNVARWVDGSYSLAALGLGAALGGFLLVIIVPDVRMWLASGKAFALGSIVIFLAFLTLVYFPIPVLAIVLTALAVFFLPVLFSNTVNCLMHPAADIKKIARFLTVAGVVLVVFLLLSVFSLTWAYVRGMHILRDQIGTILIIAVILLIISTAILYQSRPGRDSVNGRSILKVCGILIILGTVSGVIVYTPRVTPGTEEKLVVMTYNIHQGYDTAGKIDPYEILEPICRVNPDILALQESDMNRVSSTNVDIVQWLAYELGMYVYFGPETKQQIYGVAILSKFPISLTETYYLRSIEDQRVLIRADIEWHGRPLSIYAVHMGLSEEDRTNQTNEILEILEKNPNRKLLIGDLNSLPNSRQMITFLTVLKDAWQSSGHMPMDPLGYTFTSLDPSGRIDYILLSQELASLVRSCEVVRGVYGSDHLPVWAEIT